MEVHQRAARVLEAGPLVDTPPALWRAHEGAHARVVAALLLVVLDEEHTTAALHVGTRLDKGVRTLWLRIFSFLPSLFSTPLPFR